MNTTKRYSIKEVLQAAIWSILSIAILVLLVAAIRKKDKKQCKNVSINISGSNNNFFVDKNDILKSVSLIQDRSPIGKPISSFNLTRMEEELQKSTWVKSAELFFDNNEILQVNVNEREPVARVFTSAGTTFYLDNDITMLPLSEKFPARLPIFTGFPSDKKVLDKADSNLLKDIKTLSLAIQKDSFLMAMVEQVDIAPKRTFEMVPKIGNQIIVFGDASNAEEKFNKLKLFYKEVMPKAGWNVYSIINVQYKNQVVAKRKSLDDEKAADSLKALQMLQFLAAKAEREASDFSRVIHQDNESHSVDSSIIQQSFERDNDLVEPMVSNSKDTVNKKPAIPVFPKIVKPQKKVTTHESAKKPIKKTANKQASPKKEVTSKPKITMPKREL